MLVYGDKTWCPFWTSCLKGKECDRAFTEEVRNAAIKEGMWTSQYTTEPKCYENIKGNSENTKR